jgi:hypothetical protein
MTRKQERARKERKDSKVQHMARMLVFAEDERCRFPHEATAEHPCAGPDELMHMKPRTKAQTVNCEPEFRHDPQYLMRGCNEHHQGVYSYDGSIGGRGFTVEPIDSKLMYRGPCRFIDKETGELLGIN